MQAEVKGAPQRSSNNAYDSLSQSDTTVTPQTKIRISRLQPIRIKCLKPVPPLRILQHIRRELVQALIVRRQYRGGI